jgi:hypothetical protein
VTHLIDEGEQRRLRLAARVTDLRRQAARYATLAAGELSRSRPRGA